MKDLSFVWRGKTRLERFLEKVIRIDNGCWLWTASVRPDGYGQSGVGHHDRPMVAQKVLIGCPPGMVVHHKCHDPLCVRPDHMEFLTLREHSKLHAKKCVHGDTRRNKRGGCLECDRLRQRRRRLDPEFRKWESDVRKERYRLARSLSSPPQAD